MASSSEWIAALQSQPAEPEQSPLLWFESLLEPAGFVEGLPSARPVIVESEQAPADLEPAMEPEPDPIDEAYARGEAAGREAAMAEFQAVQEIERKLRLNFRAFDQAAMDSLAEDLSRTVVDLCAKTIADYTPDPAVLLERCREAAMRLGGSAREAVLHLHPDDLALIDKAALNDWKIVSDAELERGSLRFEAPDGCVSDGPAEWRRAISAAIRS